VRISGSNAGYTMLRGGVKGTGYPLHSPVSPFYSPPVRHRVPSHFNWTLPTVKSASLCETPIMAHYACRPINVNKETGDISHLNCQVATLLSCMRTEPHVCASRRTALIEAGDFV